MEAKIQAALTNLKALFPGLIWKVYGRLLGINPSEVEAVDFVGSYKDHFYPSIFLRLYLQKELWAGNLNRSLDSLSYSIRTYDNPREPFQHCLAELEEQIEPLATFLTAAQQPKSKEREMKHSKIEDEIGKLEEGVSCPGTQILRTQMSNSFALKHGLKINPDRDFTWVWAVLWGSTFRPPLNAAYGNTIREAVNRAVHQNMGTETID